MTAPQLFVALLILMTSPLVYAGQSHCSALLEFQQEVSIYAEARAQVYPVSTQDGGEAQFIQIATRENDHILYLASGADIYRPLRIFPHVRHYHLFDILAGWGNNPLHFISELKERLEDLPKAEVTVVSKGFTGVLSEEILQENWGQNEVNQIEEAHKDDDRLRQPLTLKVRFQSSTLGTIEKLFYLHFGNMAEESHLKHVIDHIPDDERLIATFQTGLMGTPKAESLQALIKRGQGDGAAFIEFSDKEPIENANTVKEVNEFMGPGFESEVIKTQVTPEYAFPYSAWVKIEERKAEED